MGSFDVTEDDLENAIKSEVSDTVESTGDFGTPTTGPENGSVGKRLTRELGLSR